MFNDVNTFCFSQFTKYALIVGFLIITANNILVRVAGL